MNEIIKSVSEVYHKNVNTGVTSVLSISYIVLNLYYLFYLRYKKCDCIQKTYRIYCIILGVFMLILLYYINKFQTKDTILYLLGALLICDILFTYYMRKQILYLENNKCYCSYTNRDMLDIRILVKYFNIINIFSIIIGIVLMCYLVISKKYEIYV